MKGRTMSWKDEVLSRLRGVENRIADVNSPWVLETIIRQTIREYEKEVGNLVGGEPQASSEIKELRRQRDETRQERDELAEKLRKITSAVEGG